MIRFVRILTFSVITWLGVFNIAQSDDTEIFFSQGVSDGEKAGNFLFMFDTSGSMHRRDGGDISRISKVKKAMLSLVGSGSNVRLGVGAFNGLDEGASIHTPMMGMEEDRCPNKNCGIVQVRGTIVQAIDDARELVNGEIVHNDKNLFVGPRRDDTDATTLADDSRVSETLGLRFSDLNIPRGVTITHASIDFYSEVEDTDTPATPVTVTVTVTAEDTGDADTFRNAPGDLTTRAKTASVVREFPDWIWSEDGYGDIDVKPLVQSIVSRGDWCGGNAMAMFLDTVEERHMRGFDGDPLQAPILRVSYDASTVQYGSSCVRKHSKTLLTGVQNDAVENTAGSVAVNGVNMGTHDGLAGNLIGLRFTDVDVPDGATITSAFLELDSAGESGEQPSVNVSGELATFSSAFDVSQVNNLSSRARTTANVDWANINDTLANETIASIDIGDVVEEVVGQVGWLSGNPVTLLLAGDSIDTGVREFLSLDAGGSAALVVNYAVEGADFTADNVALIDGRDETINAILDLKAGGFTQLVDALYESASYLTGAPVDYGKARHGPDLNRPTYRLSSPDSYMGGKLVRDPSCSEINLGHASCISEHITGNPVYTQIDPGQCQPNQLVLLTDGKAIKNTAKDRVKTLTGVASCAARDSGAEDCGVEIATWLSDNDHYDYIDGVQPVITNTVGFNFSSAFLTDVATAGDGQFFSANSTSQLVDAFTSIVQSAADTTTSFTPPSVSLSQTNRLTNSDNLYFSLFNPSTSVKWDGNLKKYKLGALATAPDDIIILDEDGDAAFNPATGGFDDNARSFWSAQTDGGNVAEGGAASRIAAPRKVLTYVDANSATEPLINLDETNTDDLTADLFNIGTTETDYRNQVIQWARGVDVKDWDGDGNITELRLQMGDPLHSSPVVIDYNNKSVLYVGTNEGFLHGIDVSNGSEVFSFIPKALLANLPQYFENGGDRTRPYGLDGPITTWIEDANGNNKVDNGEKAYLVVGMRRGGRDYYALDISNPDVPKLKWVIEGGTGDFTELGQTWSKPVKTKIRSGVTEKDVLIFAAGYDAGNDVKDLRDTSDTMGRGIFIVDATTGERIAYEAPITNTDLQYAIPSDIRAIDINLDSYIDYIFVGDLGGQLWRFDLNNDNSGVIDTALTGGVIADLGGNDNKNFRRFFYEPDVSLLNGGDIGEFLNIAIGSGVRNNPLNQTVEDRLYVVRDHSVFGPPVNADGDITYTKLTENDLFDATLLSGSTDTTGKIFDGWLIKLPDSGEKVLSKAVTINGQVLYTSYLPGASAIGSCGLSLGSGRVYAVSATYADPVSDLFESSDTMLTLEDRSTNLSAPGIPPSASALIPESSPDAPVVLIGREVLPNIDFGDLFKRTYWAEN